MKYAHIESERKFLIEEMPDGLVSRSEIQDFYLNGTRLRLRRIETGDQVVLKLGQKIRIDSRADRIARTTMYLDEAEWDALRILPSRKIHKVRHQVDHLGYRFAVDEHDDGTLIAEFDGGDALPVDIPGWLSVLREVTDDERYTGGELAS